ncbi:MAG: TusE/DsrC/DsvC family sulfur relay protein [Thiohalomonadales bacterium]
MTDMLNYIRDEELYENDPNGNLVELEPWSESIAESSAKLENIVLSAEHWDVIHFLRNYYKLCGSSQNARVLSRVLDKQYINEGGIKKLYLLFPNGPVIQASKIAGLPVPPASSDPGFGYTH